MITRAFGDWIDSYEANQSPIKSLQLTHSSVRNNSLEQQIFIFICSYLYTRKKIRLLNVGTRSTWKHDFIHFDTENFIHERCNAFEGIFNLFLPFDSLFSQEKLKWLWLIWLLKVSGRWKMFFSAFAFGRRQNVYGSDHRQNKTEHK